MILAAALIAVGIYAYAGYKYVQHRGLQNVITSVRAEIAKLELEAKGGVSAEELKAKAAISAVVAKLKALLA